MSAWRDDKPKALGYEAEVRHSGIEGFTLMGVQRETFLGLSCAAVLLVIIIPTSAIPWFWTLGTVGAWGIKIASVGFVWMIAVYLLGCAQRADAQWPAVLVNLLIERDVYDV